MREGELLDFQIDGGGELLDFQTEVRKNMIKL